jgi:predicted hotdog family 3-hydroxylacyl-ACP dehydratase
MRPAALIPHVGDAILLDEIRETGQADRLSASLTVRPGTAFSAADESLPGWIGLEILAQAISAFATLRDGRPEGPASIGLLLGVRDYRCVRDRFPVGMRLDVEIFESMSDGQALGVFDGTLTSGGVVIAEGIVSACRLADPEAFLQGSRP